MIFIIIIVRVGKQISFEARTSMEDARIFIFRAFSIFVLKAVHYMGCTSHKQGKILRSLLCQNVRNYQVLICCEQVIPIIHWYRTSGSP